MNDNIIYNLQKKFPNLKEIEIYDHSPIRRIDLKPNNKIERLKYSRDPCLRMKCFNKKLIVDGFEHIKYLELKNVVNINIPIFNGISEYNFPSLRKFHLDNSISGKIKLDNINNIIENTKKMPNLKSFIYKCYSIIEEKEYNNLVNKILKLKIKSIEFGINSFIRSKEYTEQELSFLYGNIELKYFENLKILKFNKD